MKLKIFLTLSSIFYINSLLGSENLNKKVNEKINLDTVLDYFVANNPGNKQNSLIQKIVTCEISRSIYFQELINNDLFIHALIISEKMKKPQEFQNQINFLEIKKTELKILSEKNNSPEEKHKINSLQNQLNHVISCFEKCSESNNSYCAIQ